MVPDIYTDPKFIDGFPVTISPAGNIENETEERITNEIINSAPGPGFVFVELGAGYGRWSAYVALCAKEHRPDLNVWVIAVEPDPTHYLWLREHLSNNKVSNYHLYGRPVTSDGRRVWFHYGKPAIWYGQGIVTGGVHLAWYIVYVLFRGERIRPTKSLTLEDILPKEAVTDLINIDVQGEELAILTAAASRGVLSRIRWLYIGTHSKEIEEGLHALLQPLGWTCTYELKQDAAFGVTDGIQVWRSPG